MAGRRAMGALEHEVLAQLWAMPDGATPAQVLDRLDADLAYTTVMTILTRLWEKGLATRRPRGRTFVYEAKLSEAELAAERMQATLSASSDPKAALSRFVESLSARDARALRALLDAAPRTRRR